MSQEFYIWVDEKQAGPLTIEQLRALWRAGRADGNTYYKTSESSEWNGQLSDLRARLDPVAERIAKDIAEESSAPMQNRRRLEAVRQGTCYGILRSVVNVMAGLYVLAGVVFAVVSIIHGEELTGGQAAGCFVIAVGVVIIAIIWSIAWKQACQLLIDIADILIEGSRRK